MVSTRRTPEKKKNTRRPPRNREAPPSPRPRSPGPAVRGSMFVLYPMAAGTPRDRSRSDAIAGLSLSAAAASHASDAQNEHLNNDDEEEAPPCQRRRVGTSRRDMPLAADDSLEGEGGVDEGTSCRDMPLALADDDSLGGAQVKIMLRGGTPLSSITARTWSYQSTTMSSPASRITTVH